VRSVSKAAQQAQCSRPVEPGLLSQGRVSPGGISRAADWERWAASKNKFPLKEEEICILRNRKSIQKLSIRKKC
jgi:hypothetical protein